MVKFALKISCQVENINKISVSDDFHWNMKLKCTRCSEEDAKWHAISDSEEVEGKGGPGTFNFVMKCKFCSSSSTLDVVKDSVKALESEDNDSISKQTVVVFDCRGIEPIAFDPQTGWVAKCTETGTQFNDVEFGEDGSWAGYDEKGQFPVTIDEFTGQFVRV